MRYEGEKYIMNSNPTTLSVDERIVKFMQSLGFEYIEQEYYTHFSMNEGTCEVTTYGAEEMYQRHLSLIREVCEEVIGQNEFRIPSETNNLQSKKRRIRNAIKDEQRTKLNNLLGSDK